MTMQNLFSAPTGQDARVRQASDRPATGAPAAKRGAAMLRRRGARCGRQVDIPGATAWLASFALALCLSLGGALPAQRGFDALPERFGRVVDPAGNAIADAAITIEATDPRTAEVLELQPLPPLRTTRDGSFVVPMLPAHRRLGAGLVLRIEAAGYQPWREPLPFGLAGYVGTQATLQPLRDADRYEVLVRDPRPGDRLGLRRLDSDDDPLHRTGVILPVPADGRVALHAPLLPSPLTSLGWRDARALGHEVALLSPGRSVGPVRLDPRQRRVELVPQAVAAATEQLPAGARGLYLLPDESHVWFELDERGAPSDPLLRRLAVSAPERALWLAERHGERVALPELPTAPIDVAIEGLAGGALRAWSLDAEAWLALRRGTIKRRGWQALTVDGATLRLTPTELFTRAVYVEALGCAPRLCEPGELSGAALRLSPEPFSSLTVLARAPNGEPLVGAEVRVAGTALQTRVGLARRLVTDAEGRCRIEGVRAGALRVECLDETGIAAATVVAEPPQPLTVTLELHARRLRAILRTAAGERTPFAPVVLDSLGDDGERVRRYACADSCGRLLATHLGREVYVHSGTSTWSEFTDDERTIEEFEVAAPRHAVVLLPHGATVRGAVFTPDAGDQRHQQLQLQTDAILIAWPALCARCDLLLDAGPPATIAVEDLGRPGAAPVQLDRAAIVRRVPLAVRTDDGATLTGLRCQPPRTSPELVVCDTDEGEGLESAGAQWTYGLRDTNPARIRLFHPDYQPSTIVTLPAGAPDTEPEAIAIDLLRGSRVTLRWSGKSAPPAGRTIRITVIDGNRPRYLAQLTAPANDGDAPVELTLPFALPAGHYAMQLEWMHSSLQQPLVVDGRTPVVVEQPR